MPTHESEFARAVETARARWETLPTHRAKASVFTSITPAPLGNANPWHASGSLSNDVDLPTSIVVQPPQLGDISGRIQQFSPVKIGYLIDIDAGTGLSDSLDAVVLACEDALNDGELKRPIEIIPLVARGLPREDAAVTVAGYHALCDAGCLVILGPYITDNGMALLATAEDRKVPLISTNGAKAFNSTYGFTLGNGGVSEEGTLVAGWLRERAFTRIAAITELSPGGEEYSKAFRAAAKRNQLNVVADTFVHQTGDDLANVLRHLHDDVKPDAIAYLGYGYPVAMFNPILRTLDWDPPRIMGTAFLWYISDPRMLDGLEGWYGVDQVGNEENDCNPNYWPAIGRFEHRFGRKVLHAMVGCSYDQGRAAVAGVAAAPLLDPAGVVKGLEAITMMPSVSGGPRSYISFGPHDRKGFKGDFLSIRHIVEGVPTFEGYLSTVHPTE